MEIIKKKILQATTTGTTTGCTGNSYVIIPDTGVTYNIKFLLTQKNHEWGFFDVFDFDTGATGVTLVSEVNVITGESSSRLIELKKYARSGSLDKLYFTSTNPLVDGVNVSLTDTGKTIVYYIGGITYVDDVTAQTTTFNFKSSGYSDTNNFINKPYIKDEAKQNIIDKPLIDNNVFIIREEQKILEYNYRLRNIKTMADLEYYAGGAYYNIIKNT